MSSHIVELHFYLIKQRVADLASITNEEELTNEDDEFLKSLNKTQEEYAYWEQQIDALLTILIRKGLMNVHMLRKGVESIDPMIYNKLSYYERWTISIGKHCLESSLLTQDHFNLIYGQPCISTNEQLFQINDHVCVQHENYATRWLKPHLRTPGYLYGQCGIIERFCGLYSNPEYFAYSNTNTNDILDHQQPLYRVRFNQKDLWKDYHGNDQDTIDVEIYQHWLIPATTSHSHLSTNNDEDHHHHHHSHSDKHDDDHDHIHEERAVIEQRAIDREGLPSSVEHLAESLIEALIEQKIINRIELREQIESNQMIGIEQRGANLIVEAWLNEDFKQRLLNDSTNTIQQFLKLDQMKTNLVVLENTNEIHNLIVCTLCSCYPRQLLGLPPGWYKSRSYRVRAPRNPRLVLKQFGTILPEHMKIQVHDSTADLRYLVIPRRPLKTLGWTREQLIPLVNRDSMIGVCDIII